jgi:hypothetical protein
MDLQDTDHGPYILTVYDLSDSDTDAIPEVRAASNPDPRVLRTLLSNAPISEAILSKSSARRRKYSANCFVPALVNHIFQIPLNEAIRAQLPLNVKTLLDHDADPNGYPLQAVYEYAALFWRYRSLSGLANGTSRALSAVIPRIQAVGAQSEPVKNEEIWKRRGYSCCTFWQGSDSLFLNHYDSGEGITAIEEACKHASPEILDLVLSSNPPPDISFWVAHPQQEIPEPPALAPGPSYYSVSNPLLCAIKHRQNHHLRRLLDLGFNPNTMPLACRQQCYSPLMASIISCNPPNWEAFDILANHPSININLITPIMRVHVLHMITALLSLPDLKHVLQMPLVGFELAKLRPTAAGHTLLHIACLPLDITHVNIYAKSIYTSARESRHLPLSTIEGNARKLQYYIIQEVDGPAPQPTSFFPMQEELVMYLLEQSDTPNDLLAVKDYHGNTALHYLAMGRTVNQNLIDRLLESEGARTIYSKARNSWGWTAEQLLQDGKAAVVEEEKPFWEGRQMFARRRKDGTIGGY